MIDSTIFGVLTIGCVFMASSWGMVYYRNYKNGDNDWYKQQKSLVAIGLMFDALGLGITCAIRVYQIFNHSEKLVAWPANLSLSLVAIGVSILIYAASMNGNHWKWQLYCTSIISWIFIAVVLEFYPH